MAKHEKRTKAERQARQALRLESGKVVEFEPKARKEWEDKVRAWLDDLAGEGEGRDRKLLAWLASHAAVSHPNQLRRLIEGRLQPDEDTEE